MEKTLIELEPMLTAMGATLKGAANWIERVDVLRSALPATLPGQPRMFDINHAKELILNAAFVKAGARPAQAAAYASVIMDEVRLRNPLPKWTVVAAGDFDSAIPCDVVDIDYLEVQFGAAPVTMIPIRSISNMIDNFYNAEV